MTRQGSVAGLGPGRLGYLDNLAGLLCQAIDRSMESGEEDRDLCFWRIDALAGVLGIAVRSLCARLIGRLSPW